MNIRTSYLRIARGQCALLALALLAGLGASAAPPLAVTKSLILPENAYKLETGDQLSIHVTEVDEFDGKTFVLDQDGNINLPLIGTFSARGLTIEQIKTSLSAKLQLFVKQPELTVSMAQLRSSPVFLTGDFKTPGVFQMKGKPSLLQVIAEAGGLTPDAGDHIRITRRMSTGRLPLPHARQDSNGTTYSAELMVGKDLSQLGPDEDIEIKPFDVIWADKAPLVYVNGEVGKPGAQPLSGQKTIPVTFLLAVSGGLRPEASNHVRVLRVRENTLVRQEIEVDLEKIFRGKEPDFELVPNDSLYVPRDNKRLFWTRTASMALPLTIPWMLGAF